MPTCHYCGGEIEFRYVDGKCTPIHLSGSCSDTGRGGSGGSARHATVQQYRETSLCRPSRCPKCRADVFFIRHNDGSVWLDELGPPWPKHACFVHDPVSVDKLQRFQLMRPSFDGQVTLGLILRRAIEADPSAVYCMLAIDCGPDTRICVSLKGSFNLSVGDLVLLNFSRYGPWLDDIHDFQDVPLVVLSDVLDPTLLELPKNWSKIYGQSPLKKPPFKPAQPAARGGKIPCVKCGELFAADKMDAHLRWDHPRTRRSNF